MPYKSIFETKTIITKADLCEILNLDSNRDNLNFSASEIKKAYRKRTLRIHPDKQAIYDKPIPAEDCTTLMSDAELARDYLLNNEDNIPGRAFKENLRTNTLDDWFDICINTIKNIKSATTSSISGLNYLSYLSNNFLVLFTLATYSDNKLNFRYINEYTDILDTIRPYIENINGTAISEALKQIQITLTSVDDNELTLALDKLDATLPENITNNKKYNELKDAIKDARKDISEVLTANVIANIKHFFDFWPNLIATMPSWRHIIGVYLHTMLFTAITFPKHINAVSEILKVILKQKGKLAFSLVVIPFLLLNIAILPLKLLSQISLQALPISAKVLYRLISNGLQLIKSAIHLIKMIFSTTDYALNIELFKLSESIINLSLRFIITLSLEITDALIYVVSSYSPLAEFINYFNKIIDDLIAKLKPESVNSNSDTNSNLNNQTENEQLLVVLDDKNQATKQQHQSPTPNPAGFF